MRVIGLDIGSRTVKRVTVESCALIDHQIMGSNHDPLTVCEKLLAGQVADRVVATGYGRHLFATHHQAETLTEIRAVALGARALWPSARTLLDIGGQDTKVLSLNPEGAVSKFEMNDRCAAGTGRFLEVMATALSYSMAEFIEAGQHPSNSHKVNTMCTVFAESEVISAVARGVKRTELARGLHDAAARRAVGMLRRLPLEDDILFCGGGALNSCLQKIISDMLGREIHVPTQPQIVAALGAALSVKANNPT